MPDALGLSGPKNVDSKQHGGRQKVWVVVDSEGYSVAAQR